MSKHLFATAALALAAAMPAHAALTASLPAGWDLQAYTGAQRIGSGNINDDNTLYFVQEQRVGNEQAWLVFADTTATLNLAGVLDFGAPVLQVLTTSAAIAAGHTTWGVDVDGDRRFNDYSSATALGLEASRDSVTWGEGGSRVGFSWQVARSGDAMRVITAVPEPGTYLLLALGLAAMGLQLSRRKSR